MYLVRHANIFCMANKFQPIVEWQPLPLMYRTQTFLQLGEWYVQHGTIFYNIVVYI